MNTNKEISHLKLADSIYYITKTSLKQSEYAISTFKGLHMIEVTDNKITKTNESYFIEYRIGGSIEINS
jgi:hypothetical protein